jgi:hypothetical protein
MAKGIPARLTRAEGRRFGLTVGGAFMVLAGIGWWRDNQILMAITGTLGMAGILGGLAIPTRLGPVERAWMRLAHLISKVTTPIVMGVMYLGVLLPVGVLRRKLGGNPLVHGAHEGSFWHSRPAGARRSAAMQRQF